MLLVVLFNTFIIRTKNYILIRRIFLALFVFADILCLANHDSTVYYKKVDHITLQGIEKIESRKELSKLNSYIKLKYKAGKVDEIILKHKGYIH